ncbi:lipopolysaccharide biosynthesis protein [Sphingobacterium sp. NPDC055431]
MSLKSTATSGLLWTISQQFGFQGINFLVQIILARVLLPESFGIIALLQIFIAIGLSLVDSGMASSLIRNKNVDDDDYSTVFYLNIFISLVVYLLLVVVSPYIAIFYNMPILVNIIKVYCLSFIISAFSIVQVTQLTKKMMFKEQMLMQLPSLIVAGVVSILMAYNGWDVWSIVVYNLLQNFLMTLQYWIKSKWRPKRVFNLQKLKYHFNFGYKLTLAGLLNAIFDNIYGVVIGKFFSPQILGFYNRAELFQLFPGKNISTAVEKVTYPMFADIQDDNEKLKRYYREIFGFVVFFLTPTMVILCAIAEPFFRLLLTEKWSPMVPYFQVLTIVGILHPFQRYNLNILRVKGRSDLVLKLNVIKKIILTILIIVSIPYGIYGILVSQCVFAIISVYLNTLYSSKMIKYSLIEQIKDVIGIYIIAGLVGVLIYVLDNVLLNDFADFWRILIGVIIGFGTYMLVAYFFKVRAIYSLLQFIKERRKKR